MLVIFDVVGTLFSLERIRRALRNRALPEETLELWFARLLQAAMASTLAGRYVPFKDLAESNLRQLFAITSLYLDAGVPCRRDGE